MDAQVLKSLEKKYGGVFRTTMQEKSPHDPRQGAIPGKSQLRGGDRMLIHGYHHVYAKYLPANPGIVVELGVLRGTGLAIWCDIYPNARVIGLDIDISHFDPIGLKQTGAFSQNEPSIYKFDKFVDNSEFYEKIPGIDLMIDDSAHDTESILFAFKNAEPFLSPNFVYLIEDNREAYKILVKQYDYPIYQHGKLTVIKGHP